MKWLVATVGALLIIGHALTESYIVVWKLNSDSATNMLRPFKGLPDKEISVLWYMKMFFDELLWVITYGAFAIVAKRYSNVLFSVVCVFFFYHIVDSFMFIYNYKDYRWLYVLMLAIDVVAVLVLIFQKHKPIKYKSLR